MIAYTFLSIEPEKMMHSPEELTKKLPEHLRDKCLRFRKPADQYNCVLGKLLLKSLLENYFEQDGACLSRMYKNEYGKWLLDENLDFNISHSANLVIVVASDEGDVGVDVEKKQEFEVENIAPFLRPEELNYLKQQSDSTTFFELWTKKESLLKAKGLGLSLDLRSVKLKGNQAELGEPFHEHWFYFPLKVHKDYIATICIEKADVKIDRITFDVDELCR